MEFKYEKLRNYAKLINGFAYKSKDYKSSGIPVVKIKNIIPPKVDLIGCNYVSEEVFKETMNYALKKGDILISMTGSGVNQMNSAVGKVGRVYFNDRALQNQRVGKFEIIDESKYNYDFLYYYLSQRRILEHFVANSTGSANQANISKSLIEDLYVPAIDIKIQEKISEILLSYDKKIETNNKIIANLEAQAQAIFKYYFVDFELFRDGKFIDSDLGPIPEGWELSNLEKIANYKNGVAIRKFPPKNNKNSLPALKIRELNINSTDDRSDRVGNYIDESVKVYDGDVIFSWSGTLLVKIWTGGNAGLNQHLFKVTSEKYDKWFYYLWTLYHLDKFISIARDKATTMGHIKRSHLKEAKVLICDDNTYKKADAILKPIIDLITDLGIQNQTLAQTRDALLPKLMAGEIDLEKIGESYD